MAHAAHRAQPGRFGRRLPAAGSPLGCCQVRRRIPRHTCSRVLCAPQGLPRQHLCSQVHRAVCPHARALQADINNGKILQGCTYA